MITTSKRPNPTFVICFVAILSRSFVRPHTRSFCLTQNGIGQVRADGGTACSETSRVNSSKGNRVLILMRQKFLLHALRPSNLLPIIPLTVVMSRADHIYLKVLG